MPKSLYSVQVLVLPTSDAARARRVRMPCPVPKSLYCAQVLVLLTSDAARARAESKKRGADAAANRGALQTYTVRALPAEVLVFFLLWGLGDSHPSPNGLVGPAGLCDGNVLRCFGACVASCGHSSSL